MNALLSEIEELNDQLQETEQNNRHITVKHPHAPSMTIKAPNRRSQTNRVKNAVEKLISNSKVYDKMQDLFEHEKVSFGAGNEYKLKIVKPWDFEGTTGEDEKGVYIQWTPGEPIEIVSLIVGINGKPTANLSVQTVVKLLNPPIFPVWISVRTVISNFFFNVFFALLEINIFEICFFFVLAI